MIMKNKFNYNFLSIITIILFSLTFIATGESKPLTKKAGPGEYKCGKCFTIRKNSSGCYTKFGGSCSYVSNTDQAFGGSYFYCSRSCCEK